MRHIIPVKSVPDPLTIWKYIKATTDVEKKASRLTPSVDITNLVNLNHSFDIDKLSTDTLDALDKFGFHGWRSSTYIANDYGGLSLTYNPDYAEQCDPNEQTLGTLVNSAEEFFYGKTQKFSTQRNSYFDSYGFRKHAPCVTDTKLTDFVSSFKRSLVRARIGVINSQHISEEFRPKFGWHKDEIIFENLRINIPIKTDDTYMFQLVGKEPVHLDYGNMYSWDTNIAHRVFPTTTEEKNRVHIVLGFSPWFDYDAEQDAWISNEFYGELHPFDMLLQGYFSDKIKGAK